VKGFVSIGVCFQGEPRSQGAPRRHLHRQPPDRDAL